jgi:glycine/D-amino acid oxidase-like deaminating enzyme
VCGETTRQWRRELTQDSLGSAEIAVIGGGLMGSAATYYLARSGFDVALLEKRQVNREASGANAGSLHLQIYIHPHFPDDWIERIRPTVPLMREAALNWASMESELGADCGVRLGGGLWVAETAEEMALIEKKVVAEQAMGVESIIKNRAEMLEVAPYLGEHVIGGSFMKGEGFANPLLVGPAHVQAAKCHGARIFADAEVTSVARTTTGGFDITTSRGKFTAGRIVCAVGAWTAALARMVGLELPVFGSTAQVMVTEGRPNVMLDQLLQHVGKGLTLKQSAQGTFIVGGGWPGHYDRGLDRKVPLLDSIMGNAWIAKRTVPAVGNARIVRSWSGMGGGSGDGLPIIGESSVAPGFFVAYAPLGFTMGPICGRLLSEHMSTGEASISIAPFSPDRFLGI